MKEITQQQDLFSLCVKNILILGLIINFTQAFSQIEDCIGAYPVCGNGNISLLPEGTGNNDFSNPNNHMPDCFRGENKTTWLRLKIKQAGSLGFTLIPDNRTGPNRDDYDFAVYGPNVTCNNLGHSIRCSTTNPQNANVPAETGMNESESEFSEGPGSDGNGFVHWIDNALVGEVYYVYIDNFSQNAGYTLQWVGTALLEDRITKEDGGVDLGPDINLCDNETTILDATTLGGDTYLWNTGDTTETIEVDAAGEYIVTVETSSGCQSKDTINVTLLNAPLISLAEATPNGICEPVDVDFTSSGSSADYEWFAPDGSSIGRGNDITLTGLTAADSGTYTILATRPNGCRDQRTVELVIHPLPVLSVTVDQAICQGDPVTFTANGATSLQWFDPMGNLISNTAELTFSSIQPEDSGIYQLVGQTPFNCEETLLYEINVRDALEAHSQPDRLTLCTNDRLSLTATTNQTNVTYEWVNPQGDIVGTSPSLELDNLTVNMSGEYRLTIRNDAGCIASDTSMVDIGTAYLFENFIEQCPGSVFVVPQTGQEIRSTDTIFVHLLTRNNCDSIYMYSVDFLPCSEEVCTGFPDVFAPNDNGNNEFFRPLFSNTCLPNRFEMNIYNRWGEKLFTTNDYIRGWNGKFDQQLAQQGFYLWEIIYSFSDNPDLEIVKSGGVTLLR